jgi:hypothetical protein
MRTLEEMESELTQIKGNLETIAQIANSNRPYTAYDRLTWNTIVPTTAERFKALQQDIASASNSVGDYAKNIAADIRSGKCPVTHGQTELFRAIGVCQAITHLATEIDEQGDLFNAYQQQLLARVGPQGGIT